MHGFAPEKRAFFVEALGEERVRELEEKLFGLSKDLEAKGVRFKEVIEHVENRLMIEVKKVTSPEAKAKAGASIQGRIGTLEGHLAEISATLTQLRVELDKGVSPARLFINDLLARELPAETKATKELRASGQPAAKIVADLLDGKIVHG